MASIVPIIASLFISILLLPLVAVAHGDHREGFHLVNISSMVYSDTCFTPQGTKNYSTKITHQYGPCSPQGTKIPIPGFQELILRDKARLEYIRQRRRVKAQTTSKRREDLETTLPAASSPHANAFVITVGLGSPPVYQTVSVDTGSDLSWVNCKPCLGSCPNQTQPLFDSSFSTSYKSISCNDTVCLHAKNFTARNRQGVWWSCSGSDRSKCHYLQQYGDNSTVAGYLNQDTLTLTKTNVVKNFVFGCDDNTTGLIENTTLAGLFGFGRGPLSLVSQIISSYGNVFSYCLPLSINSTGHLTFGPASLLNTTISYTPMPKVDDGTFYFIDLEAISVAGFLMDIPTTAFSTYGTIIDSGTTMTYLPQTAYDVVANAFKRIASSYAPVVPMKHGNLCYNITGLDALYVPNVVLYLRNVTLNLEVDQIVYFTTTTDGLVVMCLVFQPASDREPGVLGYLQQKSFEVVYDLGRSQIGFGKGTCSV